MSAYQPVLDPACGGRMFWFDKSDSRVLFGNKQPNRTGTHWIVFIKEDTE